MRNAGFCGEVTQFADLGRSITGEEDGELCCEKQVVCVDVRLRSSYQ
jgi:hypothetical protein